MPTAKVTVLLFAAESILPVAKARHVVGSFRKYSGYAVCCGKNSNSQDIFLAVFSNRLEISKRNFTDTSSHPICVMSLTYCF